MNKAINNAVTFGQRIRESGKAIRDKRNKPMTKFTVVKAKTKDDVEIIWIEDENGTTVCDLYHRIHDRVAMSEDEFFIKPDADKHAPVLATSPHMRNLLNAFIAATEGVFECGNIRTEAMNLMKGLEVDGS